MKFTNQSVIGLKIHGGTVERMFISLTVVHSSDLAVQMVDTNQII